ncbi:MAG: matrixin family metalloprotease [Methanosarcina sp.]
MHVIILSFVLLLIVFSLPSVSAASGASSEKILDNPWTHSPITVYIDNKNTPAHYSPTYYEQIEKALEYWEDGGNGNLAYSPVFEIVDSEEADIKIRWVENLESVEGAPSGVAGYAKPSISGDRFVEVDIVLEVGNYQGRGWRQYGDATMLTISKHELGHALGLGHSNDRGDIMYPEYELRDNLNPILLSKYGALLRAAGFIALAILLFLGVSWQYSRKKRKKLEDECFK